MKKLRKLPILLALVFTLFTASCSDDTAIIPTRTDEDKIPPPPPPPGRNAIYSDSTTVSPD